MRDVPSLLEVTLQAADRLSSRLFDAEDTLVDRPLLARRVGNVGAAVMVAVAAGCECVQHQDGRVRRHGIEQLHEARTILGTIRHVLALDSGLVSAQLREEILSDCRELLALLLVATVEAMRSARAA